MLLEAVQLYTPLVLASNAGAVIWAGRLMDLSCLKVDDELGQPLQVAGLRAIALGRLLLLPHRQHARCGVVLPPLLLHHYVMYAWVLAEGTTCPARSGARERERGKAREEEERGRHTQPQALYHPACIIPLGASRSRPPLATPTHAAARRPQAGPAAPPPWAA